MKVHSEDLVADLIQRHEAQIRRLIQRRSGSGILRKTSLEDLYQEIVAAALASADSFEYRDDARFIGWVRTIVRRMLSRHADRDPAAVTMRVKGDDSSGIGIFASQLHGRERTPSSVAAGAESARRLQAAIKALPDDYRRVVILYKIEERPLGEVASAMGRSKVATCTLLARAFGKLRAKLES